MRLLDDDNYDLEDDLPPEVDLAGLECDKEREQRFRAQARGVVLRLAPDLAEFYKTPEAAVETLRRVMNERQEAA
ncbi:MAG: hypothetical protein ACKV2V_13190 [Blastocatellia bacterium]